MLKRASQLLSGIYSPFDICFDDLSLDLVLASVEGESQKLEHNLVRTKTKIKERLKDENKCFLHKHFLYYKQSGYPAENMCHTYTCGNETKPTMPPSAVFGL